MACLIFNPGQLCARHTIGGSGPFASFEMIPFSKKYQLLVSESEHGGWDVLRITLALARKTVEESQLQRQYYPRTKQPLVQHAGNAVD